MSIDHASPIQFRNASLSLKIAISGWLQLLVKAVRDSRQAARDERIAAELPAHLRYDIGALDHIPSKVSRWQVYGSYQECETAPNSLDEKPGSRFRDH